MTPARDATVLAVALVALAGCSPDEDDGASPAAPGAATRDWQPDGSGTPVGPHRTG